MMLHTTACDALYSVTVVKLVVNFQQTHFSTITILLLVSLRHN